MGRGNYIRNVSAGLMLLVSAFAGRAASDSLAYLPLKPGDSQVVVEYYFIPTHHPHFVRREFFYNRNIYPRFVAFHKLPIEDDTKPDVLFASQFEDGTYDPPIIAKRSACMPCHFPPGEYKPDI